MPKPALIFAVTVLLAGCWNGGNTAVQLGDVSLGQQLMDLQAALEADAITPEEYERTKAGLLALGNACGEAEDEDDTNWF